MNGNAIGILESVSSNGYMTSQDQKMNMFEQENKQSLNGYLNRHPYQNELAKNNEFGFLNSCADSYPNNANTGYIDQRQQNLSGLGGVFMKSDNKPNDRVKQEDFTNFFPANDPTSDNLLDMNERPMTDFFHNNMVPFYGSKQTQNMAGTGVASGNYIDGSEVAGNITGTNTGFDNSTPMQTTLSTFTGIDDTYLHKREVGPMFSPAEQQTGWVYGNPLFRPDSDRYEQSINSMRNDLQPVEPIKVGPGLNIDGDIPASGGFHEFTRILPNNVNDYKINQLPGRVKAGKYHSAALPTSYPGIGTTLDKVAPGITKNKPNSYWDQARYPTMTTKVAIQDNYDYNRPDYEADFKPKSSMRDQTSYGLGNIEYKKAREQFGNVSGLGSGGGETFCVNEEVTIGQGPIGARISQTPSRSETWMSMENNVKSRSDCSSLPTGNPQRSNTGFSNILSNWYVNETDRGTVNPTTIEQINLTRAGQMGKFYSYDDVPKTRTIETTEYSYAGNASKGDQGEKFYSYVDEPAVTNRETTEYAHSGNASRGDLGTKFWTYEDSIPTTNKETTEYAHSGAPSIGGFAEMNRSLFTGFDNE
jgi:hypothetical protein